MNRALYHYVHCPFCVRVRMACGFLQLPYESRVLPYDDEKTPVELTGVKMLPIMTFDGVAMNESLDIIRKLDTENLLDFERYLENKQEIDGWLERLGSIVHSLAMPQWIWTPEFDDSSRQYFQKKKEQKRGPFVNLVKKRPEFFIQMNELLDELEEAGLPFWNADSFGLPDILLASHLWGLYVVPEFQFPAKWHEYLQNVKNRCSFEYHADFW